MAAMVGDIRIVGQSADVFARPPQGVLPLSKGGDLIINFRQFIDGILTDWEPGVSVTLIIAPSFAGTPISATADINGADAICRVAAVDADAIVAGTPWRCKVSYPTVPVTEIIAINGLTDRQD